MERRRRRAARDIAEVARHPLVAVGSCGIDSSLAVVIQGAGDRHPATLSPTNERDRRRLVAVAGVYPCDRPLPRKCGISRCRKRRRRGDNLERRFGAGVDEVIGSFTISRFSRIRDGILTDRGSRGSGNDHAIRTGKLDRPGSRRIRRSNIPRIVDNPGLGTVAVSSPIDNAAINSLG